MAAPKLTKDEINNLVQENLEFEASGEIEIPKIYHTKAKNTSWIHSIDAYPENNKDHSIVNMVIEIPKGTKRKMEMSVDEPLNPIVQDVKNGDLRVVPAATPDKVTPDTKLKDLDNSEDETKLFRHIFEGPDNKDEYTGYNLFSYGAIPQTFESDYEANKTSITESGNEYPGDGDPLDICLLDDPAPELRKIGEIVEVRIIGVFPMIDEGDDNQLEIDWKVIAVPKHSTKTLDALTDEVEKARLWFKYYKVKENKKNGINEKVIDIRKPLDENEAKKIVEKYHGFYKDIIKSESELNLGDKDKALWNSYQKLEKKGGSRKRRSLKKLKGGSRKRKSLKNKKLNRKNSKKKNKRNKRNKKRRTNRKN
jgi:inorganic pyrophosphatase